MHLRYLTRAEKGVIVDKGTEAPFSGEYDNFWEKGAYLCKRCNAVLYRSKDKFDATCGWPSFDDEMPEAVRRQVDADGVRTEILCARCGAHLGHVFIGEGMTPADTRHCVNSISLHFVPESVVDSKGMKKIVLGGGCFWCIEAVFMRVQGVSTAVSGYSGGHAEKPTYDEIAHGDTGHAEVVEVTYNPQKISTENLLGIFFDAHDPTSLNRQGNDIGEQYRSIILYTDLGQKEAAEGLIVALERSKIYDKPIVTEVAPLVHFYAAEEDHQHYFEKNPHAPYCQLVIAPKLEHLKKKHEQQK